ncbi:alpha-mannosidase [Microbacterium bovistercoris]|uniref:Alpha-mannosidase n=1 Tax=Microbacterium bovistercoris TaxID=2293570 RepID=A0A371NVH6_9MICO|nr:glycoside hydrolase family 38 C-terminal domain-containing protein [Microbacterium bovistercoris]REJ06465.1 alpha-mannosidase [Microbacterium bovistercoris]
MHDNRPIAEARLERFIAEFLTPALYRTVSPLDVAAFEVPDEPIPAAEALAADYAAVRLPYAWGRPWSTVWFRATGAVPEDWFDDEGALPAATRVELLVDLGFFGDRPGFQAEGLGYRADGTILKAVSPRASYLPWDGERVVEFYVEAAGNPDVAGDYDFLPTPMGAKSTAGDEPLYTATQFAVGLLDENVWELARDVWTLDGLMRELSQDNPRRHRILRAFERMMDVADPQDISGTAVDARAVIAEVLASPANASAHEVVAIGHAHIDSAWLWPFRETVRKCARTFSNVLNLMDVHPEFRFACSSAQQLKWMKDDYPQIFARIKEKVANGQFIPVGGMWVEPDINMPGGEAMARQFVAGKRFFLEEFGVDTQEVWVPDTFGYSAAFPQIIAASGSKWFVTQKISWNQTNQMPHHTFLWEGIDGTRILTHFPSADTYISELSGAELAHAERSFREAGDSSLSLIPFGWGDGGGGPTREMIAAAGRLRSLEGSPTVVIDSPQRFFERVEEQYPNPPVWSGELYLELHRGTLTSQHHTKQGNRRSEHLLREAELWAATAAVREGAEYPYDELESAWHDVLLNQFHDVLPGCSIAWVYEDVERMYAEVAAIAERTIADSVAALVGDGERMLVLNARPQAEGVAAALSIAPAPAPADGATVTADGDGFVLDNGRVRTVIDGRGLMMSLTDAHSGREAIAPGEAGNLLQLFRDIPNKWDAWDIDEHYRRVSRALTSPTSIRSENGDGIASVIVEHAFGGSRIIQTISLAAGAEAVVIRHDIDWHEKRQMLKLSFPFDIHADRSAAETQFGHVFRPTHANTSWDAARFEISMHRWAHIAEPGYGVAIANESTYGHDVRRDTRDDGGTTTTASLSLLRGPVFPDPEADQGRHDITVAVRPGAGIREAVDEGYRMNLPLRTVTGARAVAPLVTVSHPAVRVESVKLAEDRSGDLVVRLYESEGAKAQVDISVDVPGARGIHTVDLLERRIDAPVGAVLEQTTARLALRPFQLLTLRVSR